MNDLLAKLKQWVLLVAGVVVGVLYILLRIRTNQNAKLALKLEETTTKEAQDKFDEGEKNADEKFKEADDAYDRLLHNFHDGDGHDN